MSKKLFIETLGCAMNVRDSEHMIAQLQEKESYELCSSAQEADLIVINTCSVREKPVHKLFSELGAFNKTKKSGAKIGVAGCTASHLGKEIITKAPFVDFVIGARNVSKITEVLDKKGAVEIDIDYDESQFAFSEFRGSKHKAFINISIGCDKQCTFCIVPKTRGDEISIPLELIVNEAQKAVNAGAKEIFLLGQNVNNYGRRFSGAHDNVDFTDLLIALSEIESLQRIRFTSPHPLHMDDRFLAEFARNPKICKSMHMPLQSGSTALLKRMKRGYSKEWFINRALKLRALCPEVTISTDIIVGFPGESDADFNDTLDVMRQVEFDQIFSFKYSPRPHTEAAKYSDAIDDEVASERLAYLQGVHNGMLDEKALLHHGKTYTVLLEEQRNDGFLSGRSDTNILVKTEADAALLGEMVQVKITKTARMVQEGTCIA